MRRLILVRHGLSWWNLEQRVQGHADIGLTERGHDQAKRVAHAIAAQWPTAQVISSDLERCRDTATPIARALGVQLQLDADLRERNFGTWEGLSRADLERDHRARFLRWKAGEDVLAEIGGESDVALRERTLRVFGALLHRPEAPEQASVPDGEEPPLVAVTHGGTIWHGLHALLGLAPRSLGFIDNTSVTELVSAEVTDGRPTLMRFNDTGHLVEGGPDGI
jgi:broad specificity phosphatase PhoE